MRRQELTSSLINRAVEIYLEHAYSNRELAEKKSVVFADGLSCDEILAGFVDETDPRENASRSYVLQLGSEAYPHLKMALWEAYAPDEYILAVDCHDGFRFDESSEGYQEWLKVKDVNRQNKQIIEAAWYDADIDTLRRLKETMMSRSDCIREFRGHEVLLVDDDHDAAAIVRMILQSRGLKCHWASSIQEAREYIARPDCACGLALVDIVMFDGNGMEVVRMLRAEPRTQDVPVVLTSAMSGSDVQMVGVANYLRKPYGVDELVDTVEAILQQQYDGHDVFLKNENKGNAS